MGFTTHWLIKRLQLRSFCDGRYFINRLQGLGVASIQKPAKKRGTYKSPDFIFEDSSDRFHVVECKGNQQSESEVRRQLSDGIAQKRNILFADERSQVGQRLVAGLYISSFSSNESSVLAVCDPPPEDGLVVKLKAEATPFLHDTVARGDIARNMRLIGSPGIADTIMADFKRSEHLSPRRFRNLIGSLERTLERLHVDNQDWIGRIVNIPFPTRIETSYGSFRGVRITYAVQREFLKGLRELDVTRQTLREGFGNERIRLDWRSEELRTGARIYRGTTFLSELSFSK